jgi:hypothetical protein
MLEIAGIFCNIGCQLRAAIFTAFRPCACGVADPFTNSLPFLKKNATPFAEEDLRQKRASASDGSANSQPSGGIPRGVQRMTFHGFT